MIFTLPEDLLEFLSTRTTTTVELKRSEEEEEGQKEEKEREGTLVPVSARRSFKASSSEKTLLD
jgi:hypothetical protein